jgi:hypothetical protein
MTMGKPGGICRLTHNRSYTKILRIKQIRGITKKKTISEGIETQLSGYAKLLSICFNTNELYR